MCVHVYIFLCIPIWLEKLLGIIVVSGRDLWFYCIKGVGKGVQEYNTDIKISLLLSFCSS